MKLSPSTILNIGSVACLAAFALLYFGLRENSRTALHAGTVIMIAAMAAPYIPRLLGKK